MSGGEHGSSGEEQHTGEYISIEEAYRRVLTELRGEEPSEEEATALAEEFRSKTEASEQR